MTTDYASKLAAMDDGTLDAGGFSHRDHIGVAWEALQADEFFTATARCANGLRRVTARAGVPGKFNATLTLAWMSLVAERIGGEPDADSFIDAHPELLDARRVTSLFAGVDLGSDLARRVGLLPRPAAVTPAR